MFKKYLILLAVGGFYFLSLGLFGLYCAAPPPAPPTIDPFEVILKQRQTINTQRHMIAVDDELLNGFMHGTWDRSCDYEVVPGELLADGSIRETVYQICPEDE